MDGDVEDLIATDEAAYLLAVSSETVRRMDRKGLFHGVRRTSGGHRRIPRAEVMRVRAEQSGRSAADGASSGEQP